MPEGDYAEDDGGPRSAEGKQYERVLLQLTAAIRVHRGGPQF